MTRLDLVTRVNAQINAFPYRVDMEQYDLQEFWTEIDEGGGDCEDYALEKRARLLAVGVPLSDIRIGCCWVEDGQYHAVLIVAIPAAEGGGHLILDNRQHYPFTLSEFKRLGYVGHKLQRTRPDGTHGWEVWNT